ncbi:tetratricopeptide repeat protein [Myxococcota bacterium]
MMRIDFPIWSGFSLGVAALVALGMTGCGGKGGSGTSPGVFAGLPGEEGEEVEQQEEGPAGKAARHFTKLSKDLETIDDDKAIDADWLERELRTVLDLDPDHSGARYNLVILREKNGGAPPCDEFEAILDANPNFAPAAENVAYCRVEAGEVDDAAEIYEDLIKADPKALTSRLALARILQRRGQHKPAIELCRKVLQRKADAIEAFRVLAHSYRARGDAAMAELIIGRGLKISPDDVELHYVTARILLDRGELVAGIAKFKHVLKLKPKWLKVRAELAQLLLRFDDWGNALPHFEAILKEVPADRGAQLGKAVCATNLGRYDEAEVVYKALLGKNPQDAEALWNWGMLKWRHRKDYDAAMELLNKFEDAAPPGDKDIGRVGRFIKKIDREKKDVAARQAREQRERKRREAIEAACDAVAGGRKPNAAAIGSDDERIKAAWDLLVVTAVTKLQEGNAAGFKDFAECALAIIPETPGPGMVACAQLRVTWVQMQDQAGLLMTSQDFKRAKKTIAKAVECAPENPDAQLFMEQLGELLKQAEAGEGVPRGNEITP